MEEGAGMENSRRISRSREVLSEKLLGEMRPELLPAGAGMAWKAEENPRFLPALRFRDMGEVTELIPQNPGVVWAGKGP